MDCTAGMWEVPPSALGIPSLRHSWYCCCCSIAKPCPALKPHGLQHTRFSFIISWSSLKLMSIESVMPSNHLALCCSLPLLPSIFPSIRVFSSELAFCIRWPKYWSFSFSISASDEYSRLVSFSETHLLKEQLFIESTILVVILVLLNLHVLFSGEKNLTLQRLLKLYLWPSESELSRWTVLIPIHLLSKQN